MFRSTDLVGGAGALIVSGDSNTFGTPVSTITNVALLQYYIDTLTNLARGSVCPAAAQLPELSLTKQATPASFLVGVPATYTLTVSNSGTGSTTAVTTVTDTIPAGLTLGTLPASCSAAGQTVTCTIASGSLGSGASQSFILPVTATVGAIGSVTNSASVSGGGDSSCPATARCNASTSSNVQAAQLLLEKTAGSNTFIVGIANSYSLKITNQGSAATTAAATVTDTVPASLTLGALPAGCSAAGQTVTCTIPAGLSAGGYVSYILPVTPNAIGAITNSASVSGGGDSACPAAARCNSQVSSNISSPQLAVSKITVPATMVLGQSAIYQITVTNIGGASTTGPVQVTDNLPSTLTLGTLPGICSATGLAVTCTIPAGLASGSYVAIEVPVTPISSGAPLSNTASVTGGGDPACASLGACHSTITANVSAPQLKLSKTTSSAAFSVGQPASYILSVLNQGDAVTTAAATITDLVPAQLTIDTVNLPAACSANGQQVTCTVPSGLGVGASASYTIGVTPTSEQTGIVNTATVLGGGDPGCPADTNRCSSSITTDFDVPALRMTKTASSPYFTVGVPASYTLSVANNGSGPTPVAATMTDTIPATLTIGTLPAGCSIVSGQTITCTVAAGLAVGASQDFTIPVTPNVASDVGIVNRAVVSGGGDPGCPTEPRCTSASVESFILTADLRLDKVASSTSFTVGVPASYTLTVTNVGTVASYTAATITDNIPVSLTIGALPVGCTAAGQIVTCTIAAGLDINAPASFVIPVTPTAVIQGLSNTAQLVGGDPSCTVVDPCVSPTVTLDVQSSDLIIQKTASSTAMPVGAQASYTLSVTNQGNAGTTAQAIVSDTFDSHFTVDAGSLPAACSLSGQTVTCTIPAGLAPAQTVDFMINVTPTSQAAGISNVASVQGGGDPLCAIPCNSGTVDVDIVNGAQLLVQKSVSQPQLVLGVPVNYTIRVSNNGAEATEQNMVVTDLVPNGFTINSISGACTVSGQTVNCTIAAGLAVSAEQVFMITVTPTTTLAVGTVVNTVTVVQEDGNSARCAGSCSATASALFPGGAVPGARAIPTLSTTMLAALAGLMALLAMGVGRRTRGIKL